MSLSSGRDRLVAMAHPQTPSPFFDRLPSEIRQKIYEELWNLYDTRWHVQSTSGGGGGHVAVPVFPCINSPGDEDTRYTHFQASGGAGADDTILWESRLRSPWNTHWKCAEAAAAKLSKLQKRRVLSTDPIRFRPRPTTPLLVCKRMYLESIDAWENIFTFCFTDIIVARDFLRTHAQHRTIRNIDLSLRVKPLLTELYYPTGPDGAPPPPPPPPPQMGGVRLTAQTNPWEDLCRRLAALPNLRSLHIRLDSEDLRPWHKRVNERVFLAQLFRADAREYVLYLPELPEEPERQGLPGSYLQGEILKEAPFEVYRGPRPNNWQLHLSRISHTLPDNWSHTLWNQVREKIWTA